MFIRSYPALADGKTLGLPKCVIFFVKVPPLLAPLSVICVTFHATLMVNNNSHRFSLIVKQTSISFITFGTWSCIFLKYLSCICMLFLFPKQIISKRILVIIILFTNRSSSNHFIWFQLIQSHLNQNKANNNDVVFI